MMSDGIWKYNVFIVALLVYKCNLAPYYESTVLDCLCVIRAIFIFKETKLCKDWGLNNNSNIQLKEHSVYKMPLNPYMTWLEIWPRCSVILPGYLKIPGYLTKNTRVFFSTPVLLTNTRVFSIKYPGIWQPVKYPGKWQLMTAETTCGLFRRISGVLSFTDFSLSSSLMLVIFIQLFLS